uniref:TetR_C_29 domain-containing protein n=1 Tax=Caenorhabditis tropicalis TaxID=1561998 RepID=A0A1I7UE36_9PELO
MDDARRRAILPDDDLNEVRDLLLNLEFAEPADDRAAHLSYFSLCMSATLPVGRDSNYTTVINSIFNVRDGLIRNRVQDPNATAITDEEVTEVIDSVLAILEHELSQPPSPQRPHPPAHLPNRATSIHNFLCGLANSIGINYLLVVGDRLAALFGRVSVIESGKFELRTDKVVDDFTTHRILREVLRIFTPRNQ